LDATVDAQHSRLEEESRTRHRAMRDLEQQLATTTAFAERLCSEARTAGSTAAAEAVADAETRVEATRRRASEQLQQMNSRLQKVEEMTAHNELQAGGNVAAVLERLAKLEVVASEDVSRYERLDRRFDERVVEVRLAAEAAADQRGAELMVSLAKLEAQQPDAERRGEQMHQIQREVRALSAALDVIKDSQRRSAETNTVDVGRMDAVRRATEGMAGKLRMCEDLDVRCRELEQCLPVLKETVRDMERQSERLEPRMSYLEPCVKDMKDMDLRMRDLEPRLRQLENGRSSDVLDERSLRELEPRIRELEPKVRDLEPRFKEFDILVKQVEHRHKEMESKFQELFSLVPRLNHLEPRVNSMEPLLREMEPKIKTLEPLAMKFDQLQSLAPRVADLEPRVRDLEPRVREMEPRLRELEPRIKDLEPRLQRLLDTEMRLREIEPRLRDLEPRMRDLEPKLMRLHDLEPRVREFEPQIKELHLKIAGLEPWLTRMEPQVKSLEQAVKTMEPRLSEMEPRVRESLLREIEPRLKDVEQRGRDLERKASDAGESLTNVQRNVEGQMGECHASVHTESAAWRDALRSESLAWREACGELRCRTDSMREETQQSLLQNREVSSHALAEAKGESAADKVRLGQLVDGLSEVKQQLRQHTDDVNAKLSHSMNEVGWRLSRRIDEADACAGEARAAVEEHDRQLAALDQATRSHAETAEALKGVMERHRQETIQQALDAVKGKLEDASKATERCEESHRLANRAIAEFADVEHDLGKKFERFSSQLTEASQDRLQEYCQEKMRASLGDLSAQLTSCAEKQAEKAVKAAQTAAQAEAREEALALKEMMKEGVTKSEFKDLRSRFDAMTGEMTTSLASLASETARLDTNSTQLQKHEASGRDALEQMLGGLRRTIEQNKAQFSEVCDRVIPSLQGLQTALTEEKQSRGEEALRLNQRLEVFEGRSDEHTAAQRRVEGAGRGIGEGLRACDTAVAAVDKRLASLEEALEERLHDLVHNEVVRGVVSHLEDHQRGQLHQLEGKMDKIVRGLHTPSGRTGSSAPVLVGDTVDDRQQWRQRFRTSLGDSLYIKQALHHGGRPTTVDCAHNDRRCRRR